MPHAPLADVIGHIPFRAQLAGGWIDQPFISRLNPDDVGSMVVVGLEPVQPFLERTGMATGTRKVAARLWNGRLPAGRSQEELVRELYAEENKNLADPSGSQDMIGLIYPGICRLDFNIDHERGIFPKHIEQCRDPAVATWLERVLHVLPVCQRQPGYTPLETKNLDASWVQRLGRSGQECYAAIVARDARRLGESLNETMRCWSTLLPGTVIHRTIDADLPGLLAWYQSRYAGAQFSGCGGGYLYVISEEEVPGALKVKVRF